MSIISLQYGQCGIQMGYDLYDVLARDLRLRPSRSFDIMLDDSKYFQNSLEKWFYLSERNEVLARSVLVDTEEKVIQDLRYKHRCIWRYNIENFVYRSSGGAGNNWACGYTEAGPKLQADVWECVRRECEDSDYVCAFVNLLSVAGGTGSGVGSLIIEKLKDEFPRKTVINCLVMPFLHGEVTTQNYNTFMTISKIYDSSDLHIILENDYLKRMCRAFIKESQITFKDLNTLIGTQLAAVFQPIEDTSRSYIHNMIAELIPQPGLKFVNLRSTPHAQGELISPDVLIEWNILLKQMFETLRVYTLGNQVTPDWDLKKPVSRHVLQHSVPTYVKCIANTLITRGEGEINHAYLQNWRAPDTYVHGLNYKLFHHYHQERKFLKYDKFACLVSNNSFLKKRLSTTLKQSWDTFHKNLFVHQYYKHNLSKKEFCEMFPKIETIVNCYDSLCPY